MTYGGREPRDTGNGIGLLSVIGWIFADMLLVLVVIFLATQTGSSVAEPPPTSSTTTTTPPSTTTTTTPPPGVDSSYICFRVYTDPALLTSPPSPERDTHIGQIQQEVKDRLAQPDLTGRTAGIVLSFGVANQPGDGKYYASIFNSEILPNFDNFRRKDGSIVANRSFWGGSARNDRAPGVIIVNVYPVLDGQHGPIPPPPVEDC